MSEEKSYLKGIRILAVDDEKDVLDTIKDVLENSIVEVAIDYNGALEKIRDRKYDLAILDIMGVDGLKILEKTVEKNILTVMLTAHALNPTTLLASIAKGAISFLPKEKLAVLDQILNDIIKEHQNGKATWKLLFDELGEFFDEKFGPGWKEKEKDFWSEFSRNYYVSKGIQSRLLHNKKVISGV